MSILRSFCIGGILAMTSLSAYADTAKGIKALESGDVPGSVKLFQEAFEAGDADGAFYLGRLFELGLGTDKDMRRAAELYAAAASKDSVKAQNRLGLMHLNGEVVLQDYKRAAELICKAGDAGDANGQFNCGLLYSEGKGVALNAETAVSYWQKAALQDNVAAINFIGQAYQSGTGIAADPIKAVTYFERTASAGNPLGLHELAKAYADGLGVDADPTKAHGYANLAAVRGLTEAATLRKELEGKLSVEQLEVAQAFARDWKSVPLAGAAQ